MWKARSAPVRRRRAICLPFFPTSRNPILENYAQFLGQNGIEIAGIEFIRDQAGTIFTYDVQHQHQLQRPGRTGRPSAGHRDDGGRPPSLAEELGKERAKRRAAAAA